MTVFDTPALLAFLGGEDGADTVESALERGGRCCTANRSEIAQKVLATGGDWDLSRALPQPYRIALEPVGATDAQWAARRWRKGEGLSQGDRLCMALAHRVGEDVLTADPHLGRGRRDPPDPIAGQPSSP